MNFSSYLIDAFLKKFPANDITASYDDVIVKNGGMNFTVKVLLDLKINEILIKPHLRKIFTFNFDRILFIKSGIHYKRKSYFMLDPDYFSIVLNYSQMLFSNYETIGR